jgi:hypothetical protein
LEGRANGS